MIIGTATAGKDETNGIKPISLGAAIHIREEASTGHSLMAALVVDSGSANGEGEHTPRWRLSNRGT